MIMVAADWRLKKILLNLKLSSLNGLVNPDQGNTPNDDRNVIPVQVVKILYAQHFIQSFVDAVFFTSH